MDPESHASSTVEFGRFTVLSHRRELLADGAPIELRGRAFDVLMALIEARGTVLSKDDLISRVWPDRIVEENSLQAQIAALRKALAADRDLIRTVAGRGYQFAGEIRAVTAMAPTVPASLSAPTNLPEPVSELIGRDAEMSEVMNMVTAHRLVTLIGAGGIGKTRLGLEVSRSLLPRFADGVWVAELAPLSDPELVAVTVATALGLTLAGGGVSPERVGAALGTKHVLLVLDNCEHVIEAAARMAEALLRASPVVCVVATSREPLRAAGEYIYRVPSLELPEELTEDIEDLLRPGAVRLFVARARAAEPHFSPDQHSAPIIRTICRRLDGIPLAIELAAARTAALGIEELAARLDDRFKLLTGGHRTALPRHQTLRATLDWSYELLPESERVVLRSLAVFAGGFALEAASAVVADAEIAALDVVDRIANLVAKSLVTADISGGIVHYRLLETTRAYALEKLTESGEFQQSARRHAEYYRARFERAEAEWETQPTAEWLAAYRPSIGNIRTALDWTFSPGGDAAIGVALTVAAVPLWSQLSLIAECGVRVVRALARVESGLSLPAPREMRLRTALAWSLMYTAGPVRETGAAWINAIEMAERLNDAEYQLRALWGLWIYHLSSGESRATLALAQRFCSLATAKASPAEVLVGERMIGVSLHYMGDQIQARQYLERVLGNYVAPAHRSHAIRFQFDQRVSARATLVRVLWLQGLPEQAARTADIAIEDARKIDHVLSLALALEAACLLDLFLGDLDAAERSMAMLLDHSNRHAIGRWHAWGRCFEGLVRAKRGDADSGLQLMRTGLDDLRKTGFALFYIKFLGELADALGHVGQTAQGIEAIDEALARSERNDERWYIAELLRIKGELVLRDGAPDAAAAAERCFVEALDWARRQGALSWELRTATSLARLWLAQGRPADARALLAPVRARFTEGLGTADVTSANELLGQFR